MEKKTIFAETGKRLDVFLTEKFPQYSRTYFQKLINQGLVLVQGSLKKANYKLHSEEEIEVTFPPPEVPSVKPEALPLDIIYEDEDIIVINKPAGMVVHPACGHKESTLVNALLYHAHKLPSPSGAVFRPGIVHRLDKETSGVMVVAKNEETMFSLAKQFERRKVEKIYLALVQGKVQEKKGVIEAPLGRDLKDRRKVAITSLHARPAVTEFKLVEIFSNQTSLLEIKPLTGRTHQIRVHLSAIGYPICGDKEYKGDKTYPRVLLHSWKLKFFHPGKKKDVEFTAPLAEDFQKILDTLRRK